MTTARFNNFYGEGAYDIACNLDANPGTQNNWRSGRIDMCEVMTNNRYWNPIAGDEVYRTYDYKNGIHYVYIYCEGGWVNINNQATSSGGGIMQGEGDLPSMRDNPPDHPDYKSPKGGDRKVRNPNGNGWGWLDNKGRVWVPTDHKGTHAPHWDRELPDGSHENVYPFNNPSYNITPEDILRGLVIVGGVAIIIFDIFTIPSGEGMIGVEMIRRAVAP